MSTIQLSLFNQNLYRHNKTGNHLLLLKTHGNVGTFKLDKPIHIFGWIYSDVVICHLNNVTKIT